MPRPVDVGIRIWMDTELVEPWSKFGFALDNGEATHAILKVLANPKLRLHTLYSHIGTNIFVPEAYTIATEKLVALRELVYEAKGVLIPCLNLGGGFPSSVKLHGTPEDFKIPAIEEYAEAITKVLNRLPKRQRPQLRLETGRHLIDDAGYLISTVCAVKGIDRTKGVPNVGKRARGGYIPRRRPAPPLCCRLVPHQCDAYGPQPAGKRPPSARWCARQSLLFNDLSPKSGCNTRLSAAP